MKNPVFSYFTLYNIDRSLSNWICEFLKTGVYVMNPPFIIQGIPDKYHLSKKGTGNHKLF